MHITIQRTSTNHLYTLGTLLINDRKETCTVESTSTMLAAGTYNVCIRRGVSRKYAISICFVNGRSARQHVSIGHSWRNARDKHIILIGQPLIPGAVFRSAPILERLDNRLAKCLLRGESIRLTINEKTMKPVPPLRHWTKRA